jgi:hypothetical protein
MEKKVIHTSHPLLLMDVTLIPIVETSLHYWHGENGLSLLGTKQPIGVVVVSSSDKKVLTIDGQEFPLDLFVKEHPDITMDSGLL